MYVPEKFAETDRGVLLDFIRDTGWGYLVGVSDGIPVVTHLPFILDGEAGSEKLVAHMARANPHWQCLANSGADSEQLVVFPGPHAYVSPRWYKSVKAVPTWNYTAVHVYGAGRIVDEPAAVYASQKRLVDFYEAGADTPWRMEDVDAGYIDGMLRAIVGFEIAVDRLEGKFKLSQNRTVEDRSGVIEALSESQTEGGKKIAGLMVSREAGLPG